MAAWDETCTKEETGCTFRMRALCLSGSNWQNVRQCRERDDKAAEQYKGRHMADKAEHTACVKPMGSKALATLSGVGIGSALSLALCMTRRLDSSLGSIGIAEPTAAVYGFLAGMAVACGVVLALHACAASKRSSGILPARHGHGLACLLCLICLMALLGLFTAPAFLASVCSALLGACTALSGIWWFSRVSVLGINQLIHASCLAVALAGLTQALFKTVPPAGSYVLMACLCLFETLGLAIQANQISQNADCPKSTVNRMDLAEAMGSFKAQALLEDSSKPARVRDILALSWIVVASLAFSGFITGLTWDPLLSDETNWRVAFVEVVGVVAGALLACLILLFGSKAGEIRRLHLLVGAALPMAIASSPAAAIFLFFFSQHNGVLNNILGTDISWLTTKSTAFWCVVAMTVWQHIGTSFIFLLVGFRNVPEDLLESAWLDGAGPLERIRKIILPLASPQIFFVLFLNINNSFKCFNQIKLLTQGGPANSTKTLIYYIYENAIVNGRFETACVQAIFLFLMIFILTRIQFALEDKVVHYQ